MTIDGDAPPAPAHPQRPPYVDAFERFTRDNPDQIEAFVAFGLFIASECTWATKQGVWPTDDKVRESYARLLYDDEAEKTQAAAKRIVDDHRDKLVRDHQKKYLDGLFHQVEERLRRRHFWWGVWEATLGAFLWTLVLVVISICVHLAGIDLLHILGAVTGIHP